MGEILEYDELLDITLKIQEMTISNDNEKTSKKDGKINNMSSSARLDFDYKSNSIDNFKHFNFIKHKLTVSKYLSNTINEYIIGLMFNYISLEDTVKSNTLTLIKMFYYVLNLDCSNTNTNTGNDTSQGNKDNGQNEELIISEFTQFLNNMKNNIIFNKNNPIYDDMTQVSKLFVLKINTILKYVLSNKQDKDKDKIISNKVPLLNMFIMIYYILIKNPY